MRLTRWSGGSNLGAMFTDHLVARHPREPTRLERPRARSGASMTRIQSSLRFSAIKTVRRAVSVSLLAACCAIAALPMAASGQTAFTLPAPPLELPFLPPLSGDWTMTIGAQGQYQPDFEGAKAGVLSATPIFSIRRAGSTDQFRSPRDSASIALIDFGDLRAGPATKRV